MAHSVVHFAIYADDPSRAIAFYRDVFGWQFTPWGPPDYWLISAGVEGDAGARMGALSRRQSPRSEGSPNAYRCTITVLDAAASRTAIERHGGQPRGEAVEIPGVGWVCEFVDTEGNLACIMQYAPGHPLAALA